MRRSNRIPKKEVWPPKEYRLPDTLESIEAGQPDRQRELFDEKPDDSRQGRFARLTEDRR
jgi:hypothetical protein